MPNPSADFPTSLHTSTDVSVFAAVALGATTPTHTNLEGKQENELTATQTKVGTGASTPIGGAVFVGTGSGTSAWTAAGTSGQVLTSNGTSAPTWQAGGGGGGGGGLTWTIAISSVTPMAANTGYIQTSSSSLSFFLPGTVTVGTIFAVVGNGSGGWVISQNSGQTIHFGSSNSTTGINGNLASTNRYDTVELICVTANTDFVVRNSVGNIFVS